MTSSEPTLTPKTTRMASMFGNIVKLNMLTVALTVALTYYFVGQKLESKYQAELAKMNEVVAACTKTNTVGSQTEKVSPSPTNQAQVQAQADIENLKKQLAAMQATLATSKSEANEKAIAQAQNEIDALKKQIVALQVPATNQPTASGGSAMSLSQPEVLGMVKIPNEKWYFIDVVETAVLSSKVVGQAKYGNLYFFNQKEPGWYHIEYEQDKWGWVQSQFVEELP